MKLIILFLLIPITLAAQFKKIKSFEISESVSAASIDRAGDIYLTTVSGQIQKYDSEGTLKHIFKTAPLPTTFEPRDGARMFAYYDHNRSYAYLTPSFEVLSTNTISTAFIVKPALVCSAGDFNIWAVDSVDGSLKKINTRDSRVETEVIISDKVSPSDIAALREYQGFVFMLKRNASILIFSSIGKYITAIDAKSVTHFNFLGEELYYQQADKLILFDLFSAEVRELVLPETGNFVLLTDERLMLISGNTVNFFSFSK